MIHWIFVLQKGLAPPITRRIIKEGIPCAVIGCDSISPMHYNAIGLDFIIITYSKTWITVFGT
jgi:hypothetical protein